MEVIYWAILGVILVLVIATFSFIVINKKKIQNRKNDIIKLFANACKEKGIEDYKIEYVKKDTHDFYFEDQNNIYYIKVIYNFSNQEICINNAIKWQLRKLGNHNNETMSFVEGIEPLMRLDLTKTEKKEHKLFIVYPNVTALLKVINECEMVFVYPDTDVYGSQVISYKRLIEDVNLLDI
ncbi:MAG: hypothetical protein NC310_08405 [Roseburia sp.]|nr:hypothetical protein [Anaeroplasma bactoclasticum]MCM1197070.1 hypothetical protein [Roseburia sp.]MCM1557799.1 hypothetical protein [Anaeroplasma bactoclasticum]